jgi:hypothetical protein
MKEAIFSKFHLLIVNEISKLFVTLESYRSKFSNKILTGTILELCEHVLQNIITRKQCCLQENSKRADENLSDTDQQVIMYISGYILHSLKTLSKRFESSSSKFKLMSGIINNVLCSNKNCKTSTFVSKYKMWTEKVDRGGLVVPKDDFFY